MKSKQRQTIELEAELLRLNTLVRARRKTLARLAECPNKTCECRAVWHEQVEKNLSEQMGKLRQGIGSRNSRPKANSKNPC